MGKDYYSILGIDKKATEDQIKKAYRKQALKQHPDKNADNKEYAETKFKEVAEAYDVLRDPKKREIFDKFGEEGLKSGGGGFPGGYTFETSDLFSQLFGGRGGHAKPFNVFSSMFDMNGPGTTTFSFTSDGSGNGSSASSFNMSGFPGFGGGSRSQRKQKKPAVNVKLPCTLEELYFGTVKKRKITRNRLNYDRRSLRKEEKILEINIKPGQKPGTKITFEKEGDEHPQQEAADIVFTVEQKPHPNFERHGNDLHKPIAVSLHKALTGFTFPVKTLDGRTIEVSVPPFTNFSKNSLSYRHRGEGMPLSKFPSQRGDLVLDVTVRTPNLDDQKSQELNRLLQINK